MDSDRLIPLFNWYDCPVSHCNFWTTDPTVLSRHVKLPHPDLSGLEVTVTTARDFVAEVRKQHPHATLVQVGRYAITSHVALTATDERPVCGGPGNYHPYRVDTNPQFLCGRCVEALCRAGMLPPEQKKLL